MRLEAELYEPALEANTLSAPALADRHGVCAAEVVPDRPALSLEIVIARQVIAGTPGDKAVAGA